MGAPEEGRENLLRYSVFLFQSMGPRTPRARRVSEQLPDVEGAIAWGAGRDAGASAEQHPARLVQPARHDHGGLRL